MSRRRGRSARSAPRRRARPSSPPCAARAARAARAHSRRPSAEQLGGALLQCDEEVRRDRGSGVVGGARRPRGSRTAASRGARRGARRARARRSEAATAAGQPSRSVVASGTVCRGWREKGGAGVQPQERFVAGGAARVPDEPELGERRPRAPRRGLDLGVGHAEQRDLGLGDSPRRCRRGPRGDLEAGRVAQPRRRRRPRGLGRPRR